MTTAVIDTLASDTPFDASTTERLRKALLAERATHTRRADAFEATAAELGGHGGPDTIVGREIAGASAARARQLIEEIDAALVRLDNGTFGGCGHCGAPIPIERLEAVPHASFCVRCAESQGGVLG